MPKINTSVRRMPVSSMRRGGFAELYRQTRKQREAGKISIVQRNGRFYAGFKT